MAHRGTLSPRRQGAVVATRLTGMDPELPSILLDDAPRPVAIRRTRPRSASSYLLALMEGLISLVAFHSVWAAAMPVIPADERAFPAQRAMRSGACLALGTPCFVLAAWCAAIVAGLRYPAVQRPSLGFSMPTGFDEHAVLDLYVIGLAAGILGTCVPGLEVVGNFLGTMLFGFSPFWVVVVFALMAPAVYLAVGTCLGVMAPAEGFVVHTRPRKGMWGLCAVGHVVLLTSCFYSPDVGRAVGFMLGFVHLIRLLQQAFAYPATGTYDEGASGVVDL